MFLCQYFLFKWVKSKHWKVTIAENLLIINLKCKQPVRFLSRPSCAWDEIKRIRFSYSYKFTIIQHLMAVTFQKVILTSFTLAVNRYWLVLVPTNDWILLHEQHIDVNVFSISLVYIIIQLGYFFLNSFYSLVLKHQVVIRPVVLRNSSQKPGTTHSSCITISTNIWVK